MIFFDEYFMESKGKPVKYKEKTIQMMDTIPITSQQILRVVFETTNSKMRQGIDIWGKGKFEVDGNIIPKGFLLWEDTAPEMADISVFTKDNECFIKNIWASEGCKVNSWNGGAAMIVEKLSNGRRYRCNDGKPDDDFDDLIFRIEFVEE